uniref:Urotensin-related peptide 1 n=1 Tax=Scleropages formosus TaxID=113540 RepID=A0A8C9RAF1_SCLFO
MLTWVLFYMLAVFCSARRSQTFPLYSESSLVPPADLIQKLIADEEGEQAHFGDGRRARDSYPFELQQSTSTDTLTKGAETVDDLKTAVLKLAAVDSLRSHGLLQPDRSLPKTNKRGKTREVRIKPRY